MAADNYTNGVGVAAIRDWAENQFALDSDLDALSDRVDDIVAEGGEPNVIEVVKENGVALTVTNKAVDVTVPTATSDLTNDGDGNSPFATESYVGQNGGKIDVIKVDGTAQTITNKEVDLGVATTSAAGVMSSTDKTKLDGIETGAEENVIETVKVNNSALTPDANKAVNIDLSSYQTSSDVSSAISTALANNNDPYQTESDVATAVESAVVGALKPKGSVAFANLPALTASNLNNMYNVSDGFTTTADFVEGAGVSYPAGTNVAIVNVGTDQSPTYKYDAMVGTIDMSAYWTSTSGQNNSLTAFTYNEVMAILTNSQGE